jgi:hypothetical protein
MIERGFLARLVAPEAFKSVRRKRRIAHSVRDVLVAEISLDRSRVAAVIGELVAARMAQHVRMRLDAKVRRYSGTFDHPGESRRRERDAAFADEHERRLRAVSLVSAQGPQFAAGQLMRARFPILDPADSQQRGFEVDLFPTQVDQLGRSQAMPVGQQHHERVTVTVAIGLGCLDQRLSLIVRQMLAGTDIGILGPARRNCSIFSGWRDQPESRLCHGLILGSIPTVRYSVINRTVCQAEEP